MCRADIGTQAHDKGWSVAEQTSTDYGKGVADVRFSETEQEKRWYLFTQLFRLIMRNHNKTVDACKAWVSPYTPPSPLLQRIY